MKILIVSYFCYPEPDLKGLPFAKELQKKGHKVQILTTFPNYPGGRIYPGYKIKFLRKEIIEGVEILRVPLYPSHDKNAIKRIITYLSFGICASLIGVFAVRKADVMYVYHPPVTSAIPALLIKFFRRIPVVYDIQDLWPESLRYTNMVKSKFILNLVDFYCRIVYKCVDRITCLSEGYKNELIKKNVPHNKVKVIYNWSYDIEIPSQEEVLNVRVNNKFDDFFTLLYAGNMGPAQSLSTILKAAELLKEYHKIKFVFIGGGIEKAQLIEEARKKNIFNVHFLNQVSTKEIGKVLLAADVLIVHLKKDPLSEVIVPSKTQSYLMMGKPVLMGVTGEAANIILDAKAGVCCQPENVSDIVEKIMFLYHLSDNERAKMGNNGKDYYNKKLHIEAGTAQYIELFKELI